MPSRPRPLEFRLSLEASRRIKKRIDLCELTVLKNTSLWESKTARRGRIVNEAMRILEENGQSTVGCASDKVVEAWVNRERSKEVTVFKALCQAVDENWLEVFDRNVYTEVLVGEQKRSLENFMSSFFSVLTCSSEEKEAVLPKYLKAAEQIIGSDHVESETITGLIDTFFKEFALNGRKIRFRASTSSNPCFITSIKITGRNQKNDLETWSYRYSSPYPQIVETEDWWWKGAIDIQFQVLRDEQSLNGSCQVVVPEKGYMWVDISLNIDNSQCDVR